MMLCVVLAPGTIGCAVEDDTPATAATTTATADRAPSRASSYAHDLEARWVASTDGPSVLDHVTGLARSLAAAAYRPPDTVVTRAVAGLTYGQYRGIRFRSEAAIWRDEAAFQLQLFHPGGGNDTPVRIHLIEDGASHAIGFDASRFAYGDELDGIDTALPGHAGHAGFRVLYPLNESAHMDEVVSFLGASYFRLLGPGHVYGLSSRGVAVDIGLSSPEEFPGFTDFWVVRPAADARSLDLYALLDGPSLTGGYHFELSPGGPDGEATVLEVEARLFARRDVAKLGVAPLTSMYLHGTFRSGGEDDVRPRVHDSEGLLMHTSRGEWIWRPLTNRAAVRVTSLRDRDPVGFGLVQRDRSFESYLDLESEFHRRPSEWVAVDGAWGAGGVELLEIPTASEFDDNVVAYWAPDEPFRAGQERRYRYHLVTFDDRLREVVLPEGDTVRGQHLARVVRSRIGWDALPGQADPPPRTRRRVVVDFAGGALADLAPGEEVEAVVGASSGTITDLRVQPIPGGGRRATFALQPDAMRGADMRLFLRMSDTAVSETWSYLWEAPPHAR
jgi:glucans biosynthesis protein